MAKTIIANEGGKKEKTKVSRTETDASNLSGTDFINSSVGTPRTQNVSKNNVLSGSPSTKETGKSFVPQTNISVSSKANTEAAKKSQTSEIKSALNKSSNSSSRSAQKVLNAIGNVPNKVENFLQTYLTKEGVNSLPDDNPFKQFSQKLDSNFANDGTIGSSFITTDSMARQQGEEADQRISTEKLLSGEESKGTTLSSQIDSALFGGTKLSKEEIDSFGGVVIDKRTGKQTDANYVNGLFETVNGGRDSINKAIEALNNDYQNGLISADDYVKLYDEQAKKWESLQQNADELMNYEYKTGKDYYDWLKENGTEDEVRSFEEYVSSFDDSILESLVNSYKATLVDFGNRIPQLVDMIHAYNDEEFDFNDPSHFSNQMREVAEELRSYTLNGKNDQGIRRYGLQTISSLMPMINDAIIGTITGGALGVPDVGKFASAFTNVEMGIGSAAETLRKRLEEGNTVESSFWNAVAHGVITGAVEAFNVGNVTNIVNLFTGAGTNVLGLGLFSLPNFGAMLFNMAKDGTGEAIEEFAEYTVDYILDSLSNNLFGTNFSVDKSPVPGNGAYGSIGEGGLTDQMIMAFGGAFILGMPANVALTIDSTRKYNAAGEAVKYWKSAEAYYNSQNDVENAQLSKAIADFIESERRPFAETSQLGMAVQFEDDIPSPAPSIDDTMNIVANAFKLDVDDQFMAYEQNMEQMNQLATTLQDSMAQRGINMSLNDYVELNPQERTEFKKLSKFFNDNGIYNGFGRLMPGQNGMSVGDSVILNTDQSRTIDIDALADLDRETYRNAMATDRNAIFKEAGADASATTSAAHEITHYAERSGLWNNLRDMVKEMMGEERFNTAVNRLNSIYAQRGVYDADAEHEAVAFFIQKNLGNEQFLRSLTTYNDSLASRLLSSIKSLFNEDASYQLEQTFKKAVRDSIDLAVKEANALIKSGKSGYVGDNFISPTMAQLSAASYNTSGREILTNYLKNSGMSKKSQNEILGRMEETYKAMMNFMETGKFPAFSKWQDTTYDIDKDGNFTVVISNGDYDLNIDFSTVCKKRKMMDKVLNELSRQGFLTTALTSKQLTQMREIIQRHGMEVACGLCFVDAKRFNQGSWAGKFETKWNGLIDQLAGLTDLDEDQIATFGNGNYNATQALMNIDFNDPVYSAFVAKGQGSTEEARMVKALISDPELRAYVSTNSMYGSEGFEELKQNKPKLYDLVNNSGGSSKPKLAHTEVLYNYEILNDKNFNPEDAQRVGGVRVQSFSDFMTNMVFDYVQMFGDMEAKKLTGHSYTKVKEYALLFGKTGMKINLSIIPAGFDPNVYTAEQLKNIRKNDKKLWKQLRENAGLDADGNYIFDKESFDWNLALEIQNLDGYDANVGTICVGVSDRHIFKMLDDDNVCMVIPYHRSGINPAVADMMGIGVFNDYTLKQNTRFRKSNGKPGTKVGKSFDFDFYNGFTAEDGTHYNGLIENKYNAKKTANEYLRFCEDSGYIPKFDAFMNHPNYYKLLIDFRAYDKNGKVAKQNAVKVSGDAMPMGSVLIDPSVNPNLAQIYGNDIGFNNVLQKGLEVYEQTEVDQNESLDPIAKEMVEELGLKKQLSLGEERYNTGNKDVDAIMNNIFESMSAEEQERFIKTGKFEYATSEEVEDDPEVQDEGLWVKAPEGDYIKIDDAYTSNGKTVAWKDERIDALIQENERGNFAFSGHDPYQYHYAIKLSPKEYEALSYLFDPRHNRVWREEVATQPENYGNGEVTPQKLGGWARDYNDENDPNRYRYKRKIDYMFFDASLENGTLKIKEQEGNHRALILENSGYESMPVILGTDYPLNGSTILRGMDAGDVKNPNMKTLNDSNCIELVSKNRDRLINKFGSGANADIQYALGEEVVPSDDGGNNAVPPTKVQSEVVDGYAPRKKQQFRESNLEKSTVLNEEQKQRTRDISAEGGFSYQSLINKVEVQRAREYMERDGVDATFNKFMDNNSPSVKSAIMGEVLLEKLAKDNDPRWEDVAIKLADDATILGQGLQAYAILQRMSPQGQLVAVRRNMDRMQADLNERYGKNAPQLELKPELEQELKDAQTPEERQKVRDKIQKDLIEQLPITFTDMLNSWRYLAMLGNPRTHVRNILGNFIFMPAIGLKNAIGTALEKSGIEKLVGQNMDYKTKSFVSRFSSKDKPLIEAGKKAYEEYRAELENNQKYEQKGFTEKTLLGKGLNKLNKGNSWLLDWEDRKFSSARFALSYAQFLKANNLDPNNISPEMEARAVAYATNESLKATYRDANAYATWLNKLETDPKLKTLGFFKKAVLPFTKTPFNIVRRGVEYSGIGLIKSIYDGATKVRNGTMDVNTWLDEMASGLSGVAIMGLGYLLKQLGIFRTKDDDKDRKKYYDAELGEQDYAIDLGNGTYTIDWMSPVIMPLAIGADFAEAFDELGNIEDADSGLNAMLSIFSNIADPIVETSMLSSLKDAMSSYSREGSAYFGDVITSAIASAIGQLFPTIGGQIARTIDDTRRTTSPNKGLVDKTWRQIRNKFPGLSQYNEPYINKRGEEEKTEGGNWVGRLFLNMISPGYYSSKDADEYDDELYRLYDATGDIDALPSSTVRNFTYDGETQKLYGKDYTEFQRTMYKTESEYVNQFIDSKAYKSLDDQERIKTIEDIRKYAKEVAKKQYLGEEYESKDLTNAQAAMSSGVELYQYYDYLNNAGTKQADKMKYLEDSGFTEKEKEALWNLNGYKTSYEAYYAKNMGKSSSKSSSKKSSSSGSKSSSVTSSKAKVGTSSGGAKLQAKAPLTQKSENRLTNNYLKAYSNTLKSAKPSTGGSSVTCPNCGNRVTPYNGRCPICGASL